MERGFSLLELLIVVATIAVLMAIALPLFQDALTRANTSSLSSDAMALYVAFKQHYIDHSVYPDSVGATALQLDTFEPLVGLGYYSGRVGTRLLGYQADGYDAPDLNGEFWLEMTLKVDPSIRFLIADSDNAPLAGGTYYDGVFLFLDGNLSQIGQLN